MLDMPPMRVYDWGMTNNTNATDTINPMPVWADDTNYYWAAHVPAQRWNGFLCPWFTPETALDIMRDMNEFAQDNPEHGAPTLEFIPGTLTIVERDENYAREEWQQWEPFEHEGATYYAIGGFSWCWSRY